MKTEESDMNLKWDLWESMEQPWGITSLTKGSNTQPNDQLSNEKTTTKPLHNRIVVATLCLGGVWAWICGYDIVI